MGQPWPRTGILDLPQEGSHCALSHRPPPALAGGAPLEGSSETAATVTTGCRSVWEVGVPVSTRRSLAREARAHQRGGARLRFLGSDPEACVVHWQPPSSSRLRLTFGNEGEYFMNNLFPKRR